MNSLYLILLFANLGMGWCSYRFSGKHYTPALAWYCIWSASLAVLTIGDLSPELSWGPISRGSFFYLLGVSAALLLGSTVADILFRIHREFRPPEQPLLVRNVYSKQLFIFTSAAAVVMTLVFVQTGHSELGTYSRGAFASREALGTMSSSIPGALAIYVSLILSPLSLVVLMNDGLKSWWMFVPLAVILAMAVLSVAKFAVIFCCILAFNVWQFVPKKPGGYWRRFAFPLVLVLFLSGLIVTAAYLRGALHAAGDGAVSNPVVKVVYDYATGYIPAFSGFYDEYVQRVVSTMATAGEQENRFGNQTFAGIYRLLAMLGVVEGSSFNHYDGAFNVYTILRDLIVDFGVGGSLLAVLLLGFTSQLLFRLVPVNTYRGAVLNGLIFTQMQFSLMYSLFGFIFYFVCLIISPFLVGATLPNANRISSRRPRIRSLPIEPQS